MSEREQCWVINNEVVDPAATCDQQGGTHPAPPATLSMTSKPRAFWSAPGPFLDDSGQRFGTGMIIFRAATRREAEAIANSEPYIAHGVRRLKLTPWQRIAGR
jgi:uncharacterized protein YciI